MLRPSPSGPRARGAHALRALGWLALLAVVFVDWLPAHEYAHCLLAWTRGHAAACRVTYYPAPEGALGDWGSAMTGPIPWWEHPLLYGVEFASLAPLAVLAGVNLARSVARAPTPASPAAPAPAPPHPRTP